MSISVPIKLLHEAENHVVTIEIKTGEMFRGYLMEVEDTMNLRLDDVTRTARDGKESHLEQLYIRGSQIRFIIIPDMLKNAPMFKKVKNQKKAAKQASIAKGRIRGKKKKDKRNKKNNGETKDNDKEEDIKMEE